MISALLGVPVCARARLGDHTPTCCLPGGLSVKLPVGALAPGGVLLGAITDTLGLGGFWPNSSSSPPIRGPVVVFVSPPVSCTGCKHSSAAPGAVSLAERAWARRQGPPGHDT